MNANAKIPFKSISNQIQQHKKSNRSQGTQVYPMKAELI